MKKVFELWRRFEKTGDPKDYLEYCSAKKTSGAKELDNDDTHQSSV